MQHRSPSFALEPSSSDLLLVLLLPKLAKHITSSSSEAYSDGVARVRWLAEKFIEVQSVGMLPTGTGGGT